MTEDFASQIVKLGPVGTLVVVLSATSLFYGTVFVLYFSALKKKRQREERRTIGEKKEVENV